MENALLGLQYLRNIEISLNDSFQNEENPDEVTRELVYNLFDFWSIEIDKVYDELFLNYTYGILAEYKRLLGMVLHKLPVQLELRNADNFARYFIAEYNTYYERSMEGAKTLAKVLEDYDKERSKIEVSLSLDELSAEMLNLDDSFNGFYHQKLDTLVGYGQKLQDLNSRIYNSSVVNPLSDILTKSRELYRLMEIKLNDIDQPLDVFLDDTMVWVAYKVFAKLDLIQSIDKDEFKNQFGYQDRPLTMKAKPKKKTLIAKTIFQLSPFVIPEYREEWESRLAKHFNIKSYSKIKNKKGGTEEEFLLQRMVKPFKDLL